MKNAPYYISAYGLARKHGFCGTEKEWLESLKGEKGDTGPVAKDVPYEFCEKIIIGYEPCTDAVFTSGRTYTFMPDEGPGGYMEVLNGTTNYMAGETNAVWLSAVIGNENLGWEYDKVKNEFTDYYNEIYFTGGAWYCDGYPIDIVECGIGAKEVEGNIVKIYNIPIEKTYVYGENPSVITRTKTRAGEEYNFTNATVVYNIFSSSNFKGNVSTRFYSDGKLCGGAVSEAGEASKNYWHEVHIDKEHGFYRTVFSALRNCDNIDYGAEGHMACGAAEYVSPGLLFTYSAEKNINEIRVDGSIPQDSSIYIFGVKAVGT